MLDWLANRSHKTDHPMYCIEEAERLLTGLSDEPLKAVEEVASWLTTLAQAAGFQPAVRLAVVKLVDKSGQPFEPELNRLYLEPGALTEFERSDYRRRQAILQIRRTARAGRRLRPRSFYAGFPHEPGRGAGLNRASSPRQRLTPGVSIGRLPARHARYSSRSRNSGEPCAMSSARTPDWQLLKRRCSEPIVCHSSR
jgi:hypothetical protein